MENLHILFSEISFHSNNRSGTKAKIASNCFQNLCIFLQCIRMRFSAYVPIILISPTNLWYLEWYCNFPPYVENCNKIQICNLCQKFETKREILSYQIWNSFKGLLHRTHYNEYKLKTWLRYAYSNKSYIGHKTQTWMKTLFWETSS